MSSAVLPSADASRGILTPSSDGSLNRLQKRSVTAKSPVSRHGESAAAVVTGAGAVTTSPAAAADSLAMDHLLKPAVALKPHPPRLHVQPRLLHPLMLLPREHLALSCLDLTDPRGGLPPGRLFDAHIKILDLENRMGSTPRVLVARSTADATLYAVERAEDGGSGSLYTACKLGSWNDVDALAAHATVVCHERIRPPQSAADSAADAASEAIITPKEHKDQKKKRVAIDAIQSLVRKKPRAQSLSAPTSDDNIKAEADTQPEAKTEPEPEPASQPPSDPVPAVASAPDTQMTAPIDAGLGVPDLDVDPQQAAANIFDNIRSHYFEALYKSKVRTGTIFFSIGSRIMLTPTGIAGLLCQGPSISRPLRLSPRPRVQPRHWRPHRVPHQPGPDDGANRQKVPRDHP